MVDFVDRNTSFDQFEWIHHECDFFQQVFLSAILEMLPHILIEILLVLSRNNIPSFGFPKMVVVNGVDKEVLHVPAEGGKLHSQVHPGLSYSRYFILLGLDHSK